MYQTIKETFQYWWNQICLKVDKAVVFLDSQSAESLHWNGGLFKLLEAGAKTVKIFSPFESGKEMEDKVVFVITTPLLEEELNILQIILQSSSFIYCIVITTIPEYIYLQEKQSETEEGKHLFYSLEEKLIKYMGNMSYTAEIICLPVPGINVCTNFFLMPTFGKIFPSLSFFPGTTNIMYETNWKENDSKQMLSLCKKIELKALAHYLNILFEQIQVKEDIFSLGHLSHILGTELETLMLAKNRRKTVTRKVSLLLIDRTFDLAGPLSQNCYSMLDRIIRILPHLPGHMCDVAIDMTSLSSSKRGHIFDISLLAPGCLADEKEDSKVILDYFISKKQKDCLMNINRHLIEKATKLGFDIQSGSLTRRITADQIQKHVKLFRNDSRAIYDNIGLLQCALAATQTMQHSKSDIFDEVQSMEQLLLQNLAMSAEDTYHNLLYLIENRKERSLSLSIILSIISHLYALDNGDILDQSFKDFEQKLQAALVEAIFQESNNLPPFLANFIGDSMDENSVISAVNAIFSQLKLLNSDRKKLKKYRFPFKNDTRLKKWIIAVRRLNWKPTKHSRICSEHFTPDCFHEPGMNVPYLKENAVPSVFKEFPPHLQRQPSKCRIRKKRILEDQSQKQHSKQVKNQFDVQIPESEISEFSDEKAPEKRQNETNIKLQKKIKILNQKIRRRNKKIASLQDLIKILQKKGLLEHEPSKIIENHFDGTLAYIFKNELSNRYRNFKGIRYSKEMKQFALTLLYYSPKAYKFCRSILSLPHPTSIRNWISSVNAEPGFLSNVLTQLSKLNVEDKDCNLILDGMAIRKQIIWDCQVNKFIGYCDFGNEFRLAETAANEVIAFMLVALNGKWKWPIGYFFVSKVNSIVQAQLIRTALTLASDADLKIWAIT